MPHSLLPKFFYVSLLSSIITATIFTHSYSQCLDHQKTLLLQLKNELLFDSSTSTKLVQWNKTDECCNWYGVECDGAGHVISLQLDGEAISGGIKDSSSLFRLEYLEKLNLAYNEFNHTEIPRGIHNLIHLTHLNLSRAGFVGQVPLELSFLRRLVSLDISNCGTDINVLMCILHDWDTEPLKLESPNLEMLLQNLTELTELYLDCVDLSSQKSEWSHIVSSYLPNLTSLSLRGCGLSGPLHSSLFQLPSLSILRLDHNNLSTPVPHFFAKFSSLTTLSLFQCNLEGYFPEMIFLIPTFQDLDLSGNQLLSGNIPPFTQSGSLKSIAVGGTSFSGLIPSSISNLKTLSRLDLSSCKFTGLIPSTFANLTQLVSLDLSNNFFTGSLSSTIFTGLSNLAYLNLGYNSFTGSIPQSLFALPSLQRLSLEENQFSGQVEEFPIVNASKLSYLDLSSNRLEGPIPYSLFQLQGLYYLSLSYNMFSGIFELEKFRSLPNIQSLALSHNNLSVDTSNVNSSSYYPQLGGLSLASCKLHDFPDFIKHSGVTYLDLSNNRIAGEIPNWYWETQLRHVNLSSNLLTGLQKPFHHISGFLSVLDLSSNQLQGELYLSLAISDELHGNLTSYLYFLSLANNNLSGPIPTSLCRYPQLGVLDLSHNKLSGHIPPCLLQNTEIEAFNIGGNNISGHIPDSFSPNSRLISFDINNNALEGRIPKSLQSCKSLEIMNVANNFINDSFPCLQSLNLRVLVLHSNRFHGEVTCQKNWPDLQIVDISSNNFTGTLESINFSSWKALGSDGLLRHNRSRPTYLRLPLYVYRFALTLNIKGQQQELVKIWPDVTAIDFSGNSFHGEIADAIGDLVSLCLLNLSHNDLNGTIPKSFGNLTHLESLDLSMNQLTGMIPKELARLTFLSVLNLSYNKLVGVIPNGRQFQTFSAGSFQGNSELCGFPLNISCINSGDEFDLPATGNEDLESKREIEWEYVSAAAGCVVGLGSIVWVLLLCPRLRVRYFNKIEEVVEEIFDGRNRRRRRARRRRVENQGGGISAGIGI